MARLEYRRFIDIAGWRRGSFFLDAVRPFDNIPVRVVRVALLPRVEQQNNNRALRGGSVEFVTGRTPRAPALDPQKRPPVLTGFKGEPSGDSRPPDSVLAPTRVLHPWRRSRVRERGGVREVARGEDQEGGRVDAVGRVMVVNEKMYLHKRERVRVVRIRIDKCIVSYSLLLSHLPINRRL